MTGVLMRRGNQTHKVTSGRFIHRRKTTMGHREKAAICKPRRETSRETNLKKKKRERERERIQPSQHLNLELPISGIIRKQISVV